MTIRRRLATMLAAGVVIVVGVITAVVLTRQPPRTSLAVIEVTSTAYGHRMTLTESSRNVVIVPPRLTFSVTLLSGVDRSDVAVTLTIAPKQRDVGRIIERQTLIALAGNRPRSVTIGNLGDAIPFAEAQTLSVTVEDMKQHQTQTRGYRVVFLLP